MCNIQISNNSNAVDYDNLRLQHQLLPLPEHLHAEFAGQHGDDVADESGDDLYQGGQVLDHDIAGDLAPSIGDVDVELERVEEDVRERDDDTEAPETCDHCRGIIMVLMLDFPKKDLNFDFGLIRQVNVIMMLSLPEILWHF